MMVISDTGQGIAEEDISHIFQAFFSKRKTDKKGTGLGLFLSKQIVESHGGKIEVESTLGKGATFRIRVPVVEVPEAELMRSAFNAENSHC
jgi:two-component system sensor histidine kinase ResE